MSEGRRHSASIMTWQEKVISLGAKAALKAVLFLLFARFCYEGGMILFEWASGKSQGFVWSPLDKTLLVTSPAVRWISAAAVTFVFLLTIGYILYVRIRWIAVLLDILKPTTLPERYTRRVRDAVEGISIASGIQPPEMFFLDLDCLNAFTVSQPGNICLFLTRGLLVSLDREELTAVAAHEFAHIKADDVNRFRLPGGNYWRLVKARFRDREWLKLAGILLPVHLWIAVIVGVGVLTAYDSEAASLFIASLMLLLAVPPFILLIDYRPRYRWQGKRRLDLSPKLLQALQTYEILAEVELIEIEADGEALSWTYFPQGLIRALNKCHGRSYSPLLSMLDGIAFAGTIPSRRNFLTRNFSTCRAKDYYFENRLRFIETMDPSDGIEV